MRIVFKKVVSMLLAVMMVFGVAAAGGRGLDKLFGGLTAEAATITSYSHGDVIEFGWYPQSQVTDSSIITALNAADGEWISYGYYSGTGTWDDGKMVAGDYMRYKDVMYGSDKYRGVVFDTYRPYATGFTSDIDNSVQDENGYEAGTIYWFKYEPIKWRVLDPNTGLVISEIVLDNQAYNNYMLSSGTDEYGNTALWGDSSKTYYANNYAKSSIREWLNNDFYNTAFSSKQQDMIQYSTLDNSAYLTDYSAYDSESTYDKIFLLSYSEALNTDYFSSNADRPALGSDYAKCQGLLTTQTTFHWRLRSPGYYSYFTCDVSWDGTVDCFDASQQLASIRPAMRFNLSENITYTLTYNTNGGSNAPSAQKGSTTYTISSTIPTRSDYTFLGWSKNRNATLATYAAGESITLTADTTLYAVWKAKVNIYNIGEETYSFINFTDNDSFGGHCFGMSITSAGYYIGALDVTKLGISSVKQLNTLSRTTTVSEPICFYQARQTIATKSIVAGGCYYKYKYNDINSDWNAVVNYVKNHAYDNTGSLQIGFRKGESGHAINFLYYAEVNGEARVYAYDNNYPTVETYFYMDANGNVKQAPKQTFNGSIDCICLRSIQKYFSLAESYDSTRYIETYSKSISIPSAELYYLDGEAKNGELIGYEIPDGVDQVVIIPLTDNAEFIYLGEEYNLGNLEDDQVALFTLSKTEDEYATGSRITIVDESELSNVTIATPSTTTISYGDAIILHADVEYLPNGTNIVWTASNGNFDMSVSSDGTTCKISPQSSGSTTFTATIYDADGNAISTDEQTMTSKAGFFDKIIAFFKKLFGLTKTIAQTYKYKF